MVTRKHTRKLAIASLFLLGTQLAFAAFTFTGITEKKAKENSYSLKNMHHLSAKAVSYSSLKYSLHLKNGSQTMAQQSTKNGIEVISLLRYNNGNTSYVYPYKFKVKVPKFKTPAPAQR
ncbi:MAG: hypothetical protein ACOYVG_00560 [Bacteroidota bacterium]|jgi:hypothetical protein